MTTTQTIVCAIDGSDHAEKAAEIAADLALLHSADLRYVHVLMRDLTFGQLGKYAENIHLKDIIATEQKAITELMTSGKVAFVPGACEAVVRQLAEIILLDAKELGEKRGVNTIRSVILDGHAAERILSYCEKSRADILIVGTRGLSGVKNFLLGSVSQKLMNHSTCTCVCVSSSAH
ncbi:MAG: universal stress protein [Burkholderiaceae bacterium]